MARKLLTGRELAERMNTLRGLRRTQRTVEDWSHPIERADFRSTQTSAVLGSINKDDAGLLEVIRNTVHEYYTAKVDELVQDCKRLGIDTTLEQEDDDE